MKQGSIRKWLGVVAVLTAPFGLAQDATLEAVLRELQALQGKAQAQEMEIRQLKSQLQQGGVSKEAVEQVVDGKLEKARGAPLHPGRSNVDFGASDAPMKPEELDKFGLVQFPMIMGGVCPVANLKGIAANQLRLTPWTQSWTVFGFFAPVNASATTPASSRTRLPSGCRCETAGA